MGTYTNAVWHDDMSEAETALANELQESKFIGYGEWGYGIAEGGIPQGKPGDYLVLHCEDDSLSLIYWQEDRWRIKSVEITLEGATFTNDRKAGGQ